MGSENVIFGNRIIWEPAFFMLIVIVIGLFLYLWGRLFFRRDYNKGTEQVKPFNSGNLEEIDFNIRSSNLYWGFKHSIDFYYRAVSSLHDGDLNNYIKWLVITVAACLLLAGGGVL